MGGEGTPGAIITWVQQNHQWPGSLLVCLDCWVPMGHSWSTIPDTNLHLLYWSGHLQNDTAIIKIDWDCCPCHLPSNWARKNRCQIPSFLSSLCNTVMAIPSFLPHLIRVIGFSMLLGVTLQHAYILSQVLARVYLQPVLWKHAPILVNSLVSKFIVHPPLSGTIGVQSQAYCPSWMVLKLDSRRNSCFPPLAIPAGPLQSYFMT